MLAVVVSGNLFAQKTQQELNQLMQQRNEYYFTFNLNGNDDLNAIAHTISVDRVDGKLVTAYANNHDFARFQKLGYEVTLLTPPSLMEEVAMWDGSNRAAYDWDSYPTYSAYEDMMFQFATDHPDKCEIITLGTLPSGRKIMVAHLNNGTADGKPKFLYTSTIHGDEGPRPADVVRRRLPIRNVSYICSLFAESLKSLSLVGRSLACVS